MRATEQDGSYPRPMLCRDRWASLDGAWGFASDDADEGRAARWFDEDADAPFDRQITVPFPPESPASGIGERGFHPIVWYRRRIRHEELVQGSGPGSRILIHFGAVDYRADVWLDGHLVCSHVGGQSPFTADVTDAMTPGADEHVLVVRAEDDPADVEQPRGKQDWLEKPHGIWYERTTGIWQTVWTESVPGDRVVDAAWTPDIAAASVHAEITLSRTPRQPMLLELTVSLGDEVLCEQSFILRSRTNVVDVAIDALRNGQDRDRLLWSPEHPTLLDVALVLRDDASGAVVDSATSYLGLRSVSVGGGSLQLNGHPYYLRAVLDQGYRPQTHLASTGSKQLRTEVELAKEMGFNAVRVHQKAEDPRFLFWADRLGLLVWGETAGAYAFSAEAVTLLMREWVDLVRRDRSHPSIVVWVPVNESWGVQAIATEPAQQSYARALADVTRALDPSRPVVTNEGWEHVDSDIFGLHDYATDPAVLRARYGTRDAVDRMRRSAYGPAGRRLVLDPRQQAAVDSGDAPLMITEFGGISMSTADEAWGYATVTSEREFAERLLGLFDALRASADVAGFCYTQFMDTAQETNGLLLPDATPKLPLATLRRIVTGVSEGPDAPPQDEDRSEAPTWQ